MPDLKISQLPLASTPLAGTELVPIVQGGTTDQTTIEAILKGTVPSGTANGVLYLNASNVVTSGNALTFDGTKLSVARTLALKGAQNSNVATIALTRTDRSWSINNETDLRFYTQSGDTETPANIAYQLGASGVFVWNNTNTTSELMRLNATGLGIGTNNPLAKLSLSASGNPRTTNGTSSISLNNTVTTRSAIIGYDDSQNLVLWNATNASGATQFYTGTGSGTLQMTLDSSGNLGLGVTPSAWNVGSAIDISSRGSISDSSAVGTSVGRNAYYNSAWRYKLTSASQLYLMDDGGHKFFIAPSGTAGNTISFTQAMTLDSSGRLLLGTTSATGASMDIQATSTGTAQLLNIQNLSSGASAVSRFTLGSQGGNWHIDNERTGAPLKFTLNTTLFLQINSSGSVVIGNGALTTTTTDGFLYTASCAGVPTGAPTAYTGRVPMVVDTTNLRVYFNIGGTWRYATLT